MIFSFLIFGHFYPTELFEVLAPKSSVTASLDSSILLICRLSPPINAETMEIRWIRNSFRPYVHLYINGGDEHKEQMEEFKGRTDFITQNITRGSVALRIHKVQLSDQGSYTCYFESESHHSEAQVEIKAA
ncbi:hypothetical protein GDO86_019026, partial [Hymenochirus boettgeri]